jgi:signal transduction histidine kinase/ActR/RegA family two-component response regulator
MPHRPRFSLVQLEAIIDAVASGVVVCDPAGRVLAMNTAALALHGMASSEEIARREGDFSEVFATTLADGTPIGPADWPGIRASQGDRVEDVELVVRRTDTDLSFIGSYTATPIHDHEGNVSLVILSIQDISAMRRQEEGLRQRDRRLATALAAGDTGTFRWTIALNTFDIDHALEQLLGALPGSMEGLLALLHPDVRADAGRAFRACAVAGHELELETSLPAGRGPGRYLAWRGRALRDASGAIVAVTGTCQDVSGRRLLEARLRQMERAESVGRLAGGVAHEVNNQMSVVLGCAEFVLQHAKLPEEVREDVEQMRLAGQRSAAVTSQLLAFSRRQLLRPEVVEFDEAVRAIAPALERTMGEDRHVRFLLDAPRAKVLADVGQLHQVLINLSLNAREATVTGGEMRIETAIVTLGPEYGRLHSEAEVRHGRYVLMALSDNGRGMPREVVDQVFEPFFTTKEIGEGTGLGLSTVYGIVKQSGGYIWVYSEVGHGTVFKIYLPLVQAPAEVRPPAPPERSRVPAYGTVLVVEDEQAVRAMVVRALREAGFAVRDAADANSALEQARSIGADLVCVVSDVVMPDLDGRALAKQITEFASASVLFMSGYTEQDATLRGLLDEGLPFLQKPFRPSMLVAAVQALLAEAKEQSGQVSVGRED